MVLKAETALDKPKEGSTLPLHLVQHVSIAKLCLILEAICKIAEQLYLFLHMLTKHHASNMSTSELVSLLHPANTFSLRLLREGLG